MLKQFIDQIMLISDSGKLLKKPVKWLYTFFGLISFIPAILFLCYWLSEFRFNAHYLGGDLWSMFICLFLSSLIFFIIVGIGMLGFRYWINRKNNLDDTITTGSKTIAIPIFADIIQCFGEINSIFIVVFVSIVSILVYFGCLITDGMDFYSNYNIFIHLFKVIGAIVGALVGAYLNILITRFIAERIRLVAQINNDVHRMTTTAEKVAPTEAENPNVKFTLPTATEQEKKIGLYILAFSVVFALIAAIIIYCK